MASSSSSSVSSSSTLPWKHDVFLSFRGEDTRKNFTDHLYTALKQRGIITFRDDVRLERGEEIEPSLLKAIEDSRFAIVIFSRRYADSTWCLKELAKIMTCQEERGQTVLPVFYDITPSEVQEQTGGFGLELDKHEEAFKDNKGKVEKWRLALKKVGNLSGWDVADKHQSQIVAEIVDRISSTVQPTFSTVLEGLVGIDFCLKELKDYLTMARNDVNFIGIHGMGGIGKTTMARVLFDMFESQYEGSIFLANIREVTKKKGLIHLQKQLLYKILKEKDLEDLDEVQGAARIKRGVKCRRVFLVFDDVDKLEQLQWLAGKQDWYGCGSIIIITTRDKHLLTNHGVDYIHDVKGLYDNYARKLLFLKAFKKTSPTDEHLALAEDVLRYANGLPLAIEVLGNHLCDRDVRMWKGTLDRLKEIPNEIVGKLRISYDGLQDVDKKLFLDIACFFKGKPIIWVEKILDENGCGITILKEKSLIKISYGELWMHDLVQEMGWKIVREEHTNEPGRRSRLRTFKDFYHLATKNTATEMVEGIMVDVPREEPLNLNGNIFSNMYNLRLLKINNIRSITGLTFLSNDLRALEWHGYPLKSLPSSFEGNKLVELKMNYSNLEYLWKGMKRCEMLKTIELRHSYNLIETLDFTLIPNLERLDIEGCTRLHKVHESVGILKKLTELNLKNCKSLVSLPSRVCGMKSLKALHLRGCSKLKKLPFDVGELEGLEVIDMGETAITEWPSSLVKLRKLNSLCLSGIRTPSGGMLMPKRKMEVPPLTSFQSLETLNLRDLDLEILPDSVGSLSSLECLYLSRNNFVRLPISISQLSKLDMVDLEECRRLQSLAGLPSKIYIGGCIYANGCTSLATFGCPSILESGGYGLKHYLSTLHFSNCLKLLKNQSRTYDEIAMWIQQWIQGSWQAMCRFISIWGHHRHIPYPALPKYQIMVPGSNIPYWINISKDGDSFIMKLPPYWYNHNFMGFIFSAIIQPNKICDPQEACSYVTFRVHSESYCRRSCPTSFNKIIGDHLVLSYEIFYYETPDKISLQERYARVTCETEGPITVKRCGIRLVSLEDSESIEVFTVTGRVYEPAQDETDLPSFEVLDEMDEKWFWGFG